MRKFEVETVQTTLSKIGFESPDDRMGFAHDPLILARVRAEREYLLGLQIRSVTGRNFGFVLNSMAPGNNASRDDWNQDTENIMDDLRMPDQARRERRSKGRDKANSDVRSSAWLDHIHRTETSLPNFAQEYIAFDRDNRKGWIRALESERFDRVLEAINTFSKVDTSSFDNLSKHVGVNMLSGHLFNQQMDTPLFETKEGPADFKQKEAATQAVLDLLSDDQKTKLAIMCGQAANHTFIDDKNQEIYPGWRLNKTKITFGENNTLVINTLGNEDTGHLTGTQATVSFTPEDNARWRILRWEQFGEIPEDVPLPLYAVVIEDGQRQFMGQREAGRLAKDADLDPIFRRGDVYLGRVVGAYQQPFRNVWEDHLRLVLGIRLQAMRGGQVPLLPSIAGHDKLELSPQAPLYNAFEGAFR